MSDNKVWDIEVLLEDEVFDYVEYAVNSWREWIAKTMNEIEKIEMKEVKLLTKTSHTQNGLRTLKTQYFS